MWLFNVGRFLGLFVRFKPYIIVAGIAFTLGIYSAHKIHSYIDDVKMARGIERVHQAAQDLIDKNRETDKILQRQIQEVLEHETNNVTCFSDADLRLFNDD
jgi:hypothetical protein